MNINELRDVLSTEAKLEQNPFAVLQAISSYINDSESENTGRELVLRALEKKDFFAGFYEVLDAMVRHVGLFPYVDVDNLGLRDLIAYEFHRPSVDQNELVFHRAQAEVYRRLLSGDNVVVSAPTSFGKSRIIDALIASDRFANIAVIVPTIALIDETRRRLASFRDRYKIVTQASQEPAKRNIFVFTAERLNAYESLPKIEFFAIDEFYKIGALTEDESRTIALNQAFYRLYKTGAQFYMLGPNIKRIPSGLEDRFRCFFYSTDFATVVSEIIPVFDWKNDLERLLVLAEDLDDQTLIFCRSPKRVNDVVRAMVEKGVAGHRNDFAEAAHWIGQHFHPDWIFHHALQAGIGMHHGRLPRSLAQMSVRAFNDGRLKFLVCTSTLIEGVNTRAKNVVIFDNVIAKKKYDFFTFNNIRGRSGRMFHHFIGKVYVFHQPPQEELPFVDFPLFTQDEETPASLLVQIDDEDLSPASRDRLATVRLQTVIPVEIIRKNSGVDPEAQVELAKFLESTEREEAQTLAWTWMPSRAELYKTCEVIWQYLLRERPRSGVYSAKQLAFKTIQLMNSQDTEARVNEELRPGQHAAKTPDEAVERVLEFDRNWAGFELPRVLMAMSNIQEYVLTRQFGFAGDYRFFARRLESLFRNPVSAALEEYGLPMQITDKIERAVKFSDDMDVALEQVRRIQAERLNLTAFERELFIDTQSHL